MPAPGALRHQTRPHRTRARPDLDSDGDRVARSGRGTARGEAREIGSSVASEHVVIVAEDELVGAEFVVVGLVTEARVAVARNGHRRVGGVPAIRFPEAPNPIPRFLNTGCSQELQVCSEPETRRQALRRRGIGVGRRVTQDNSQLRPRRDAGSRPRPQLTRRCRRAFRRRSAHTHIARSGTLLPEVPVRRDRA